jgi:hypothetical protein
VAFDQFMAMPGSRDFELIGGRPIERLGHGAQASAVTLRTTIELAAFVHRTNAGHLFAARAPYRCFGHGDTVRRPGITFIRRGRLAAEQIPERALEIPADLLIHPAYANEAPTEAEAEARLCLRHGFGEAWIVRPADRALHVSRRDGFSCDLSLGDTLVGQGPLAGFAGQISELFPD